MSRRPARSRPICAAVRQPSPAWQRAQTEQAWAAGVAVLGRVGAEPITALRTAGINDEAEDG